MHRLAALPGQDDSDAAGQLFVEQAPAPVVLLSSADTDLVAIESLLQARPALLTAELRALNLAALSHPAVIDHYIRTSLAATEVVIVRLLGGRGHWSYGLEQLRDWAARPAAVGGRRRQLLVLAGTAEEDASLGALGTVPAPLARALAAALREGGAANLEALLTCVASLLNGVIPEPPQWCAGPDPLPHDWRPDPGPRVGLIVYRALLQAGDLALVEACLQELRAQGLAPRALWVSSLRDPAVQRGVGDLLEREAAEAVLCSTGFASVQFEDAGLGAPLWERLQVPVLQLLCSGRSRRSWQESSIGLGPLDLSLQIALPELDGRITTRVGAFKEVAGASDRLGTALQCLQPDPERLQWIVSLTHNWIQLRRSSNAERRVALVLANYPTRNSRLANGVGLDTPASVALMLGWLAEAGYGLGAAPLPADGDALIRALLAGRSNDPESSHRPALGQLSLADYQLWYQRLPADGRQRLEAVWGPPEADRELESGAGGAAAFPIRGLRFDRVVLLIQPARGYDRDPSLSYHSPDLPPTHAYLAQYLWLRQQFAAQVVVHVGKHGNLEWLPGKGLGLSASCFPEWALGPLPHLYPFIVNDPGEGSQAKRRAQAVILDHLTPPLGRAGLYGPLQRLETLLDEYWEASQLGAERALLLREQLAQQLQQLALPGLASDLDQQLEQADGYLCELKEAQIRLGLHTYGTLPEPALLAELLLCLARAPQAGLPGFTQALARDLGLELDPWADGEEQPLSLADRQRLSALALELELGSGVDPDLGQEPDQLQSQRAAQGQSQEHGHSLDQGPEQGQSNGRAPEPCRSRPALVRLNGDGVALLEQWALLLVRRELQEQAPAEAAEPRRAVPGPGPQGAVPQGAVPQEFSGIRPGAVDALSASTAGASAAGASTAVSQPPAIEPLVSSSIPARSPSGQASSIPVEPITLPSPGPATTAVLQHLRQRLKPALLACGEAERAALLQGLAGGRIAAGPAGAPTRGRPDLLPTGRNFYSVDLRGLPSEAAWDLGRRSAELLLELHLLEQGDDLRHLALSVWGTATMRNGGEDIAQALALMGVRPLWDGPTRRLVDLEVVPLPLLGRPRVDVTLRISGLFRDAFPQLVAWFNRATRLVAALAEEPGDNPLAAAARREGQWGRVYGSAPGAYGAGLQGLIDSGHWEERGDLGEAFLNWSQWRYDGDQGAATAAAGIEAKLDRDGLEQRLRQVQVVLHNQDNREHDLLDSDDYYQFQGGLSAAVERLSGQRPALWFGDHSRSQRPRLQRLERELDKVLRSRLLNPRWIQGMQSHGYKGGFEMAASLDYLFAYDASTGRVPAWGYGAISKAWLDSAEVLAFLRQSNPWALRDMAERLLEAHHRGLWQGAEAAEIARLGQLVLDSEALIET